MSGPTDEQIAANVPGVTAEQVAEVRAFLAAICPTCDGDGVFMVQSGPRDEFGNVDTDEAECPECEGTGRRCLMAPTSRRDHQQAGAMRCPTDGGDRG